MPFDANDRDQLVRQYAAEGGIRKNGLESCHFVGSGCGSCNEG